MKILIVSGFLGAGKTTFIKELARQTKKEFAILENEYGNVGVDGDRLKEQTQMGEVNIWEMAEGCICCSMKGDFAASVLTIANTVAPEYLVVEPTGVGMLSSIVENLQQIEYERISLLKPITIVDGQLFFTSMGDYTPLYLDQVKTAGTVIVSKMEQASNAEKERIHNKLKELNPKGRIHTEHYTNLDTEEWDRLLEQAYDGTLLTTPKKEYRVELDSFSLQNVSMERPEALILMLEKLIRGEYGYMDRAKGQVKAGEEMFCFDVVNGRYTIIGQEVSGTGKAVFIGKEIQRQKLRRYFMTKDAASSIEIGSKNLKIRKRHATDLQYGI